MKKSRFTGEQIIGILPVRVAESQSEVLYELTVQKISASIGHKVDGATMARA